MQKGEKASNGELVVWRLREAFYHLSWFPSPWILCHLLMCSFVYACMFCIYLSADPVSCLILHVNHLNKSQRPYNRRKKDFFFKLEILGWGKSWKPRKNKLNSELSMYKEKHSDKIKQETGWIINSQGARREWQVMAKRARVSIRRLFTVIG